MYLLYGFVDCAAVGNGVQNVRDVLHLNAVISDFGFYYFDRRVVVEAFHYHPQVLVLFELVAVEWYITAPKFLDDCTIGV
jgi:hypothetical protein